MNTSGIGCVNSVPFSSCSNDLVIKIACFCRPKDVCNLAQVARKFRAILDNVWEMQEFDRVENRQYLARLYSKVLEKSSYSESLAKQVLIESLSVLPNLLITKDVLDKIEKIITQKILAINDKLLPRQIAINAQIFTTRELKALNQVYNTPLGASLLVKSTQAKVGIDPERQLLLLKMDDELINYAMKCIHNK